MEQCPPNCIAVQTAKFQEDRHRETMARLEKITENQEQTIKLLSDLNNLSKNFDEYKQDAKKDFDDIFERLRILESEKVSKADIAKFMTVLAAAFAILQILFKWVIP